MSLPPEVAASLGAVAVGVGLGSAWAGPRLQHRPGRVAAVGLALGLGGAVGLGAGLPTRLVRGLWALPPPEILPEWPNRLSFALQHACTAAGLVGVLLVAAALGERAGRGRVPRFLATALAAAPLTYGLGALVAALLAFTGDMSRALRPLPFVGLGLATVGWPLLEWRRGERR